MVAWILSILPLTWLAWEDVRSRRIPNEGIILLLMCGLIKMGLGELRIIYGIYGLMALGVPVFLLAILLGHGAAIGGGDVKLCAAIGFLLGPLVGCMTIYIAVLLLALCGLIIRRKALPFAPFVLTAYSIIFILRSVLHV